MEVNACFTECGFTESTGTLGVLSVENVTGAILIGLAWKTVGQRNSESRTQQNDSQTTRKARNPKGDFMNVDEGQFMWLVSKAKQDLKSGKKMRDKRIIERGTLTTTDAANPHAAVSYWEGYVNAVQAYHDYLIQLMENK